MNRVKLSVVYPYPPEKVWQALTDCRILSVWMMKNDFEPRVGHKFKFESESLPGIETIIHCEVIELEKPQRLVYTWQDRVKSEPSLVVWTLTPVEGGTQLELKHLQRYAAISVGDRYINQINNSHNLYQQPIAFHRHSQVMHQIINDVALGDRQSSLDWHYRLNHKLLEILMH